MKFKEFVILLFTVLNIAIAVLLLLSLLCCNGLKLQATPLDNETPECFYARYHSHEGDYGTAAKYADACLKIHREKGCIEVLEKHPKIYKDFNDCWKTRE